MTGQITDAYTGIKAQMLTAAGFAGFVDLPTFTAAIFPLILPPSPDRCVAVTPVPMNDEQTLPIAKWMFQLRYRGAAGVPLDVHEFADPIHLVLQNLKDATWGSIHIIQIGRTTSLPATADGTERWERVDQYYADVDVPATALLNATSY